MRLFKRKKESDSTMCPRCSQLVSDDEGLVCPMCGWDLRDAYQGPTVATVGAGPDSKTNGQAA